MSPGLTVKITLCIFVAALFLYFYIQKQNELVELRMKLPALEKEVNALTEEINRLQYEIDRFESPIHLMELRKNPEYSHLKFPELKNVIIVESQGETP